MARLNLGAGADIRQGWINHDLVKRPGIDIAWDLNKVPWPWPDNAFEIVLALSVLEHLQLNLIQSLDECWRIIQPGGVLSIKFPLHTSPFIHHDPTHRWYWSELAVDFVDPTAEYGQRYGYYTDRKWQIVERHMSERNCWASLKPVKPSGDKA